MIFSSCKLQENHGLQGVKPSVTSQHRSQVTRTVSKNYENLSTRNSKASKSISISRSSKGKVEKWTKKMRSIDTIEQTDSDDEFVVSVRRKKINFGNF